MRTIRLSTQVEPNTLKKMAQIFEVDCGMLAGVQKFQEDVWNNPIQHIDKKPEATIIKTVLANQEVNFVDLQSKEKRRVVHVEWPTKCNIDVDYCTDDCDIEGEDVTPECKPYEIECLFETSFKMAIRAYRDYTADFEKNMGVNMLLHKKALVDRLNSGVLGAIIAGGGTNAFAGGVGNVTAGLTTIPAAYWDENIWGYFAQVIEHNQFSGAYMLSGDNLYQQIWNMMKMGNTKPYSWINPVADPRAFASIGASNYSAILHKTAVAFLNKAWNPVGAVNAIPRVGGQYLEWSEPLTFNPAETLGEGGLNNVFVDITLKETCENDDWHVAVKMKLHGAWAVNPLACDDTNTGILVFECD